MDENYLHSCFASTGEVFDFIISISELFIHYFNVMTVYIISCLILSTCSRFVCLILLSVTCSSKLLNIDKENFDETTDPFLNFLYFSIIMSGIHCFYRTGLPFLLRETAWRKL